MSIIEAEQQAAPVSVTVNVGGKELTFETGKLAKQADGAVVVRSGDTVVAGQLIGYVSPAADACGPPGGCLHWGALQSDLYIDPMGLLRAPRVRLLPIWSG